MRKKFKTLAYLPAIALFGIGIIRCVGGGASAAAWICHQELRRGLMRSGHERERAEL